MTTKCPHCHKQYKTAATFAKHFTICHALANAEKKNEILNTLELTMTASEKIDVLSIVCNEINDQYHEEIPSDILLDVLTYVIILSNIDRPYDHINYMNEYMTDINGKMDIYLLHLMLQLILLAEANRLLIQYIFCIFNKVYNNPQT